MDKDRYYRCPNSGRIVVQLSWDDKVICRCGKPNPSAPRTIRRLERIDRTLAVHVAKFLPPATPEEYDAQLRLDQIRPDPRTRAWQFL